MHPIITDIGPFHIYSYGLMIALGFAAAIFLAYRHAHEFGLNKDKVVDFGITILFGGITGARLLYVLLNIKYYIANPLEIINLDKGGLVWYGGFLFGILVAVWFVKKNKINFWDGADLFAPYIALAQSIGRIGCLLNGCCYGSEVSPSYPLCVVFPNESVLRHPTQVYSSLALLLLFMILRRWQKARRFKGEIFLGYMLLYALTRFSLEFIRGDNARILFNLTISQLISVGIFALCSAMFVYRYNSWKKNS